jgi:hypothetical protein
MCFIVSQEVEMRVGRQTDKIWPSHQDGVIEIYTHVTVTELWVENCMLLFRTVIGGGGKTI